MSQGRQPREPDRTDPYYFYQDEESREIGRKITREVLSFEQWDEVPEGMREVVVFGLNQVIESHGGTLARVAGVRDAQADDLRQWQHVYRLAIAHLRKIG